mgnify:CR=1 FL=1
MKKRFLIVGDFLAGSGLTGVIFNIFPKILNTNIWDVTVIGYGKENNKIIDKQIQKLGWKLIRTPLVTKDPIRHWKFWKKYFKKNNFDYIYFNYSAAWNFLPVKYAKKYTHAHIAVHSHNTYYGHKFNNRVLMTLLNVLNNYGKRQMLLNSDIRFATSKEAAVWMFGTDNGVNISQNGIDLEKYKFDANARKQIRDKYHILPKDRLYGFVGVLQPRKNPLFVVKLFYKLYKENNNSKLVMIGAGELKDDICDEIKRLKLEKNIILIDFCKDVNKWYSAMDMLFFPSLYEGLPLVLVEAQASGLKILTSFNIPEVVIATPNIYKMKTYDLKDWIFKSEELFSEKMNRTMDFKELNDFSCEHQAKKIKNVLFE